MGGTGKTPHTEYLLRLLNAAYKTAVLSRGYKRKTRGTLLAQPDHKPSDLGDEPFQIWQKFPETELVVDGNRRRGAALLRDQKPEVEVLLMDDGFQHRSVRAGFNIVLMRYDRLISQDRLLPYGRLREQASGYRRAQLVLVTHCPENLSPIERRLVFKELELLPFQHLYFTSYRYGPLTPVFDGHRAKEDSGFPEKAVLVTGIAHPEGLQKQLEAQGVSVTSLRFPDHHAFTETDLGRIQLKRETWGKEALLISTEKDAVRLREIAESIPDSLKERWFFLPIEVYFQNEDQKHFDRHILQYVQKNSKSSPPNEKSS